MDRFPQTVGNGGGKSPEGAACVAGDVMNYYDGNTVTALWNYAQRYAMSDNSFGTTFGPSSPGAINLASGNTGGVDPAHMVNSPSIATAAKPNADLTPDGHGGFSLTSDAQPYWDDCSTRDAVAMSGPNVGDELNVAGLSWGFFEGGFRATTSFADPADPADAAVATGHAGQATATFTPDEFKTAAFNASVPHSSNQGICNALHPVGAGLTGTQAGTGQYGFKDDYIPHHRPFQYYASTANPHHLTLPTNPDGTVLLSGLRSVGTDTQKYIGGQPQFDTPNHHRRRDRPRRLRRLVRPRVLRRNEPLADRRRRPHRLRSVRRGHVPRRRGRPLRLWPRQPLLVISPWARTNAVDHALTDQASILRFVEDNWGLPQILGSFDAKAGSLDGLFDFGAKKGQGRAYGTLPTAAHTSSIRSAGDRSGADWAGSRPTRFRRGASAWEQFRASPFIHGRTFGGTDVHTFVGFSERDVTLHDRDRMRPAPLWRTRRYQGRPSGRDHR